jgi:hypothetical protein
MSAPATTDAGTPRRTALPVWAIVLTAGIFGLFFGYAMWTAVAFVIQQAEGDAGLTGYGWFVLLLPVVFPAVVFAGAFALGWRRRILPFALVMLSGLCLVAVFWINVFALAVTSDAIYNLV